MAYPEKKDPADCGGRAINLECCAEQSNNTEHPLIEQGNVVCLRCRRALWVRSRFPVSPALARYLSEMAFPAMECR